MLALRQWVTTRTKCLPQQGGPKLLQSPTPGSRCSKARRRNQIEKPVQNKCRSKFCVQTGQHSMLPQRRQTFQPTTALATSATISREMAEGSLYVHDEPPAARSADANASAPHIAADVSPPNWAQVIRRSTQSSPRQPQQSWGGRSCNSRSPSPAPGASVMRLGDSLRHEGLCGGHGEDIQEKHS
jgi:hypothetical protein